MEVTAEFKQRLVRLGGNQREKPGLECPHPIACRGLGLPEASRCWLREPGGALCGPSLWGEELCTSLLCPHRGLEGDALILGDPEE